MGSEEFKAIYCQEKVSLWCQELEKLSRIAQNQPQAAYAAFVHGYKHKFTYFLRTIPQMERFLQPVDDILTYVFIPTIFGSPVNEIERKILTLPTKLGGLGIPILCEQAPLEYKASTAVTKSLVEIIKSQSVHEQPSKTSH